MITQNGLNLFKMLLTNSCPDPSAFTNIDGNTAFITSLEETGTYWQSRYFYYSNTTGTTISGTLDARSTTFMPDWRYISRSLNQGTLTNQNTASASYSNYINYLSEETSIITIPTAVGSGQPTLLGSFYRNGVYFVFPYMWTDGPASTSNNYFTRVGIYGTAPSNLEYLTITIPKCFNTANTLNIGGAFGMFSMNIFANLGYSNNAESVDDYDLVSPVYNKSLSPITMNAKLLDKKIEISIAFKNSTSESISVNELGLYNASNEGNYKNPIDVNNKISFNGYQLGNNEHSYFTLCNETYITRGFRPNLIVRKVLPQTVTIPPDGVATFKYTIDLSEMKAQENIAYEQA